MNQKSFIVGICMLFAPMAQAQDSTTVSNWPELPAMVLDSIFSANGGNEIVYNESVRPFTEINWMPLYLLIVLPIFSLFSYVFRPYLFENWKVISNFRLTDQVIREREFANSLPGLILLFLFCASLGVLTYMLIGDAPIPFLQTNNWILISLLTLAWPLLYLMRSLLYRLFTAVFHFSQQVTVFRFQSMILYETAGYILFPLVFLAFTSDDPVSMWCFRLSYILLSMVVGLRWWSLLRTSLRIPGFRFSYFFLYFCAFEIAPTLILIRMMTEQVGLV